MDIESYKDKLSQLENGILSSHITITIIKLEEDIIVLNTVT